MTTVFVSSGAVNSGFVVTSGDILDVLIDGTSLSASVSSGGIEVVFSGGTAIATNVFSGGLEYMASGGIAASTVVSNGGTENVGAGGIASGGTINSGGQLIDAGLVRSVVLSSGAVAYVQSGGAASGMTVFGGGAEVVRSGGATSATTLSGGATLIAGSAVSTTVGSGSVDYIASGGIAYAATVLSGGQENVGAGGVASGVTVSGGGSLLDGGSASSVLLLSGAAAYITSGGVASGLSVVAGAADIVSSGGVASGTVLSGAAEAVFGGTTVGTTVSGFGGVEYVGSGGTASNTLVSSGGQENIAAGGTGVGATILSGAVLMDAGKATSVAVSGGAAAFILSGGSITGTTVAGADIISSGGVASGTMLSGGVEVVFAGGAASGATVGFGGVEYVASGGVGSGAVVSFGGQENIAAGGVAIGTTVSASGLMLDAGTASGTVLSSGAAAYVESGGVAVGTILRSGGTEVVLGGGVASGTTFSSGGIEAVLSGGVTLSALVGSGGLEYVTGGGVASAATISGGTLEITSGGSIGTDAVTFAPGGGGILQLDNALTFGGLVAGFALPDLLDLRDIAFIAGTTSATWTQSGTSSGTLAVTDNSHTANITLLGQYAADQFTAATDGHAGTLVTVQQILQTLAINRIAGDDVVNAAEAQQSLSIGGTATGLGGLTVMVAFNGNQYAAQIAGDGTWSATVPSGALTTETLPDGSYQVAARVNSVGGAIQATRALVIDETPPPTPVFDLSKSDQTGSPETHETQSSRVSLVGATGAGDAVSLLSTGQTTIASTTGAFQFADVDLALGANPLAVQSTDFAGNTNTFSLTVDRQEATGSADLAVQWNQIALNAIKTDASTPIFASRALAIESLAVFDAVSALNGTPGYLLNLSAPADADVSAAVAQAAHDALAYLFPAQKAAFDADLSAQLDAIPDGQSQTDGMALGALVAAKFIALRANDGWNATVFDEGSTATGQWRPTGPSFMPALAPQWGDVTPFAMTTSNQFDPAGPPALSSQAYADAVNQTESLGAANSTTRTADQTQIANFWKDGTGTFTPPGHWNNIADQVAQQQGDSLAQNARLLAELNVALADAGIAAWNTKYSLNTWRPITVIQNADSFANAGIIQDTTWQPLIVTPNFPEYISGHSTFSAAAADILTQFFGTDYEFTTNSSSLAGVTRSYTSFDQAAQEAGISRIYGGIHFMFSNTDGLAVGQQVGDWTLRAFDISQDVVPPKIGFDQTSGLVINHDPTITGIVTDNLSGVAGLQVTLDTTSVMDVAFNSDGTFSVPLALPLDGTADGSHTLRFTATDAQGNVGTPVAFGFTLATRAPQITLGENSVHDGNTLAGTESLAGTISVEAGDSLTGLSYDFDGGIKMPLAFDPATGAFDQTLDFSKLASGNHVLTLRATDAAGNSTTQALNVSLPALPPLTVTDVTPIAGAVDVGVTYRPKVTFSRAIDPATLTSASFFATDSTGAVVPATVVPFADSTAAWLFFTDPLPGASTITLHLQGDQIKGADGTLLDATGSGTPGSDLTETFTTVSTAFVPGTSITGIVVDPGPDSAPMTPDDVKAAPDGLADFANDTWKLPIAGVKVFVLGHEDEPVFTDAQGRFTLSNVPTGDVKIEFDGTAATNAPSGFYFPVMVMDTTIRPGIANTIMGSMGSPDVQAANTNNPAVYLPRLATNILTTVSDTAPTVVTAPSDTGTGGTNLTPDQLNQLSLTVQPGSIVDENGNPVQNAQVGISPVPASLVMDMLPPGLMQHTFDITIQVPNGATFTTPAVLTMPNVFGAAPGTKLDILSFDHTTGRLVIDGTGTVSADGQTVVSDPGSGVTAPGWHGMAPPGGSGHGNVGGGHGNNNNKDPCDAANSQFQDSMKDSFFAIADAYGLEAALLGLATGKDSLVKSLGLPPSATDLIKKLNYVALGTDVLALANHINKLDSPAAERDILYIALDVLSFVPELAYPAGGARTAFAVWDLTNDIDTMRADAEKMRQAYEQCLNSSSAMPETAVSATGVVGGIGGLQQSFEDAADRALAEFTLQKPIWLDLSQQWLDVAAILKTIDRDNHIAGGLTATQVQSLVDKLNVMIDEGKTIAARPDLNATINAAISANGMVRPCSCPASDRSWQGAPKTRSTP